MSKMIFESKVAGNILRVLSDHSSTLYTAVFSPVCDLIVTGSRDTTIKIYGLL